MKKILFLHGFFATGSCPMARVLREAFDGQAIVLTPDLPLHPKEALKYIRMLIDKEKPDLLIGNSCGAFLAQMLSPVVGIPALLGNPHFKMTDYMMPISIPLTFLIFIYIMIVHLTSVHITAKNGQ